MNEQRTRTTADRLASLRDELIEVFLVEGDPKAWPGNATPGERGDRYWYKKNAEAVGRLAIRAFQLAALVGAVGEGPGAADDGDAIAEEAKRLEASALRLLGHEKLRRAA